jgi:flagellar protein FliS
MYGKAGIAQYQQVNTQAATYADPFELTGMLFNGALDRIAQARGAMESRDVALKGERIGKAIAIIDGLRASLDHQVGGELAANLESLYDYVQRRLVHANLHNDTDALDEAARLMREIKAGWDAIPPEARNPHGQAAVERDPATR